MSFATVWRWRAIYDSGEVFDESPTLSVSHLDPNKIVEVQLFYFAGEPEIELIQIIKEMLRKNKTPSEYHGRLESLASQFPDEIQVHHSKPKFVLKIDLSKGERFIKFWRRTAGKTPNFIKLGNSCEILGLQKTVNGKNVKFFVYINNLGECIISSNEFEI